VANAVLSILSITLNTQQVKQGSDQISPVVTFQLNGIVGDTVADIPLFVVLVVINLTVTFLTFALLVLVIQIRKMVLDEKRANTLGLRPISRDNSKHVVQAVTDFNIPGTPKSNGNMIRFSNSANNVNPNDKNISNMNNNNNNSIGNSNGSNNSNGNTNSYRNNGVIPTNLNINNLLISNNNAGTETERFNLRQSTTRDDMDDLDV